MGIAKLPNYLAMPIAAVDPDARQGRRIEPCLPDQLNREPKMVAALALSYADQTDNI